MNPGNGRQISRARRPAAVARSTAFRPGRPWFAFVPVPSMVM
jgi:hypothetical protein